MLDHEVSSQLPCWPCRSTTCHERPVAGSWNLMTAWTRLSTIVMSGARSAVSVAGMFSSTSMLAIMNQPWARHQVSGAWPVVLFAHEAALDSSHACLSRPLDLLSRCL